MIKYRLNILFILLLILDATIVALYFAVGGEQFDLDAEFNIPTFYQSLKIACAAVIAMTLAYASRGSKIELFAWGSFALGFSYLVLDEWFQIHEAVSRITDELLIATVGRVGFSAWIVAYTPVMLIALAVLYVIYREIITASKYKEVRKWFALSVLTIFMVPVVEVVGTLVWDFEGPGNKGLIALEEGLEMVGITLFAFTLLKVMEAKLLDKKKLSS